MYKLRELMPVRLAVSLHAVSDELRDKLVPVNRQYPLDELMKACQHYQKLNEDDAATKSCIERITLEYVMLKNVNDSLMDAREVNRLIQRYQLNVLVNLIPFNPWPGSQFECSDVEKIHLFSEELIRRGVMTTIRTPMGRDIAAACGQLNTELNQQNEPMELSDEEDQKSRMRRQRMRV